MSDLTTTIGEYTVEFDRMGKPTFYVDGIPVSYDKLKGNELNQANTFFRETQNNGASAEFADVPSKETKDKQAQANYSEKTSRNEQAQTSHSKKTSAELNPAQQSKDPHEQMHNVFNVHHQESVGNSELVFEKDSNTGSHKTVQELKAQTKSLQENGQSTIADPNDMEHIRACIDNMEKESMQKVGNARNKLIERQKAQENTANNQQGEHGQNTTEQQSVRKEISGNISRSFHQNDGYS